MFSLRFSEFVSKEGVKNIKSEEDVVYFDIESAINAAVKALKSFDKKRKIHVYIIKSILDKEETVLILCNIPGRYFYYGNLTNLKKHFN